VLAHVLSRSSYGDVARSLALALAVAQVTMAGLAPAIARAVAAGDGEPTRWARAAGAIRLTVLSASGCALLVVPLAAAGLAPWSAESVVTAVLVAAVYATYFCLKCILFALDVVAVYAQWELAADLLFFATLAGLAVVEPRAALATFAIAYGLFIVGIVRLLLRRSRSAEAVAVDRRYAALATVATYTSVARLPLMTAVVGAVAGSHDAAGIAGVVAIVMPLFLVPQAAGMLTFAAFARGAGPDRSAQLAWTIRAVALCSTAVVVPMVLLARPLVSLLLGSSYRAVAPGLAIVALAAVPQLVATPVGNALSGEGAAGINAVLGTIALATALVGAAILTPRYHVTGAASALAASMVVLGLSTLFVGRARYFGRIPNRRVAEHDHRGLAHRRSRTSAPRRRGARRIGDRCCS
jgi:O-antigen/teichoic acid export membrane protein